jgi:hypothetical protein
VNGAVLIYQPFAFRAGIADGGEFYIRPPELLPGFLLKINNMY